MVEETEISATADAKVEPETSPAINKNHHKVGGEESDAEEGEIVGGDPDDAAKAMAPPPKRLPLEHSWTFWFDSPSAKSKHEASAKSKQEEWGFSNLRIYTFSTVEDFWGLYNNIHHPSKLANGADLYCFKNTIEPKWEDPVCADGGKWTVIFSRGKSDTWLYTLLAMIGEQFDYGDEICGVVVNARPRQEKFLFGQKMLQMKLLRQWKEFLDCNDTIGFIFHEDAKKQDRAAKNRYTV